MKVSMRGRLSGSRRVLLVALICSAVGIGCTDPENHDASDACRTSDTPEVPPASIETVGSWPGSGDLLSFEGWATVERSTPQDWVLYVQAQQNSGDNDTAASAMRCNVQVRAGHALPRLARGARVWLQLSTDANTSTEPRLRSGTQLTLRAQEHGALLYSSIHAPGTVEDGLHAAALPLLAPRALCSRSARCILGGQNVVYSLEARADEPVRVAPGTHAQLILDGLNHDLWLAGASQSLGTPVPMLCGDLLKDEHLWVSAEIQAQELERVTSQLTQGTLPACTLGNDPGSPLSHGVSVVANGIVEGDAKLRDRLDGASFVFDLVGTDLALQLQTWPAGWKEPTAGEAFWLSASVEHFALREKQSGPILIASGAFSAENMDTALVSQWFGTPVTVEPDCAYERAGHEVSDLYRMRIGVDPGVTLTSGTATRIELNGQPYDAWMTTARRPDRSSSRDIPYVVTRVR